MSTADLHKRLGYTPGDVRCWCGTCERNFTGAKGSFKCLPCAELATKLVGLDEQRAGGLPRYDAWKPRR
jgi:hypothetical protein